MKKLLYTLAIAMTVMTLCAPAVSAQGRSGRGAHQAAPARHGAPSSSSHRPSAGHSSTSRPVGKPGNAGNAAVSTPKRDHGHTPQQGSGALRPSTGPATGGNRPPGGNSGHNRPGGVNNGGSQRPGNNPGSNNRPGGVNNSGHNRPGGVTPGHNNNRPGGPVTNRPNWGGTPNRPGATPPGVRPGHHTPAPPPMRPMRPAYRPWSAPPPPPSAWRPGPRGPRFSTLFGISFGTNIAASINLLAGTGYTVDGYLDDAIYLRNVNEFGYLWPDATMYYNTSGALIGSRLYFSLPYYSTDRFMAVHAALTRQYGPPAVNSQGSAVWYGPSGDYISLSFGGQLNSIGQTTYVTTLSFGR